MKKILLSSFVLSGILFANQLSYIPLNKSNLANENGGEKTAIEAYSDGVGIYTVGKFKIDNSPMNELVFVYGEEAKKSGETLKEFVLDNGSNKEKDLAEKLGNLAENKIPEDGTPCDDKDNNTENDIYINGICKGEEYKADNCYDIYNTSKNIGNGLYEIKNGKTVYCDMNEGGWTLVTLINRSYSSQYLKNSLNEDLLINTNNDRNQLNYLATYSNEDINKMKPKEIMIKKENGIKVKAVNINGRTIPDFYDYYLGLSQLTPNITEKHEWIQENITINGNKGIAWRAGNQHIGWGTSSGDYMLFGAMNGGYVGVCINSSCWTNQGGAIYIR
jgi:hypothetical protein